MTYKVTREFLSKCQRQREVSACDSSTKDAYKIVGKVWRGAAVPFSMTIELYRRFEELYEAMAVEADDECGCNSRVMRNFASLPQFAQYYGSYESENIV